MIRIEGATVRELDVIQTALSMLVCHIETGTTYLRHSDIQRMGKVVARELKVEAKILDREQRTVVDMADAMRLDTIRQMNERGEHPVDVPTPGPAKVATDPFDTEV